MLYFQAQNFSLSDTIVLQTRRLAFLKSLVVCDFDKTLIIDKKDKLAFYNRATAKDLIGDYQGALDDFDKIKANPNFTVIGHLTHKNEGIHLITRANTKFEAYAPYPPSIGYV